MTGCIVYVPAEKSLGGSLKRSLVMAYRRVTLYANGIYAYNDLSIAFGKSEPRPLGSGQINEPTKLKSQGIVWQELAVDNILSHNK